LHFGIGSVCNWWRWRFSAFVFQFEFNSFKSKPSAFVWDCWKFVASFLHFCLNPGITGFQ
ncbi:unnamed protein product, partial [Callosobruchus maculatus]